MPTTLVLELFIQIQPKLVSEALEQLEYVTIITCERMALTNEKKTGPLEHESFLFDPGYR